MIFNFFKFTIFCKKIFIITTLIFALTSCLNSTNTQDLDKAKSDLLH